jgi:glycosyltransferase involved in cell wall biosynthesis
MPNRPVRVTHVVFDLHGGGMESLVGAMGAGFAGSNVRMSVVTLGGREGRVGARIRTHLEALSVVRSVPGLSMLRPTAIARALRHLAPDVVHLHSGCWYKGALAARLAGVPRVIFTEHGREHDDPPLSRWLGRRAAHRTDTVVAVSERLAEYMRRVVGVDPAKICTIPNGLDTAMFRPGAPSPELARRLDLPPRAIVVGSIGRLEPVKAYDRLIEAVAKLRDQEGAPLYLVLCGDGSERTRLEALAASRGLGSRVRLPGWVNNSTEYYHLFDVFALTSLSEGTSVSLLEAMACGVAPLVTDVGGNRALLGPDLADQQVPPDNPAAFAAALSRTVGAPGRRREVARIARRRVVTHFALEGMLEAYRRLYSTP